jgi:hypothetical protein
MKHLNIVRLGVGLLIVGAGLTVAAGPAEIVVERDTFDQPPRILYFTQQIVEIQPRDVPLTMKARARDYMTIGFGSTVVLDFAPSNLIAPNTYRDGDHCYSGNVLHVDGTRIPVTCPEGKP